ncbi:MAG: DUF47 family protein [Planctomycetes bacterium]|nr:DUF47 family protein [Planctomycetota bacterium]
MRRIGGLFGRSPFGPMHEHLLKVLDCLGMVGPLVEAACRGDAVALRKTASDLARIERQADRLKKAIRTQLTTSVFASVSRSEIMALVKAQDDVADQCERIAYELSIRRTDFPAFLAKNANALAAVLVQAAGPLGRASRILDKSGGHLGKGQAQEVGTFIEEIRTTLVEAESVRDRFLKKLFRHESEVEVLDAVFLMKFADRCDKAAGKVENVADILTRLITEGN